MEFVFEERNGEEWVVLQEAVPQYGPDVVKITPIMSKSTFIECYKRWISEEADDDK